MPERSQPAGRLVRIEPVVRTYAWGSPTAVPALLGQVPTGEPVAELWFGAHPDSPSTTPDGPLDAAIAADPAGLLDPAVAARFGDRLPFLLKILAADHALSIQVHPTLAQARAGYADEQARGVAADAPDRNYRDANHKPELLCALTDFDALCGFRPVPGTARLLASLGVAALDPVRAALGGREPLRSAFELLLELDGSDRAALLTSVLPACARLAETGGEWELAARASVQAGQDFPGDVGAVLALLLNAVRLRPGEAIYLGAGTVHAYLHGLGIEVMANSDNVLRCGLTPKHVDVAEVLRVADFVELTEPRCRPQSSGPGEVDFVVPVPDFELSVLEVAADDAEREVTVPGPQILLCTAGTISVSEADGLVLVPGQAVFAAAGRPLTVTGAGTLFRATSMR